MKLRCLLSLSLALLLPLASFSASFSLDSQGEAGDSVKWMRVDDGSLRNLQKLERKLHHHLNEIDTNYIEPQRYDFTVMLQSITTYELYRLKTTDGKSITFAPTPLVKMGPYFGWRWIFFGYTIDVKHMFLKQEKSSRKEYDVSIYSSRLGIDLFYRETGNDYKIRRMSVGEGINTHELRGLPFSGLTSTIKGFNIYYIFNYRHFSYPAAFSQSTIQRRSAGSPMLGIGYTRHTLSVDWQALDELVKQRSGADNSQFLIDEDLLLVLSIILISLSVEAMVTIMCRQRICFWQHRSPLVFPISAPQAIPKVSASPSVIFLSTMSTSTASGVLPLSGTRPGGMPAPAPCSMPTTTTKTVFQPTTYSVP